MLKSTKNMMKKAGGSRGGNLQELLCRSHTKSSFDAGEFQQKHRDGVGKFRNFSFLVFFRVASSVHVSLRI